MKYSQLFKITLTPFIYHLFITQLGGGTNCDQLATGFTGVMTLVDGDGGVGARLIDGTLWFAATNGQYATFGIPFYFDSP